MQIVANSLSYVVQLYCILFQKGSIAIVGPVALRLWCILAPSMNMNKRCSPKLPLVELCCKYRMPLFKNISLLCHSIRSDLFNQAQTPPLILLHPTISNSVLNISCNSALMAHLISEFQRFTSYF